MTILAKLAISPISPTSPVQIFTASVVRHIMPLPTLFLASEFYSDISILVSRVYASCIYARSASLESLVIPWRFLGGSLVVTLPKAYPNRT